MGNKKTLNERHDKVCLICRKEFMGTVVQKYCSNECRKIVSNLSQKSFNEKYPHAMKTYNENRKAKNPSVWKEKWNNDREQIISLLGGKCIVCEVSNPHHLHIDYIPTMIGTGKRHPRHKAWIIRNIKDFRLLCANHHYELTLTGKINGTGIIQKVFRHEKGKNLLH